MIFSKSFGYAVRGLLYIAWKQEEKSYVQAGEIAANLAAPKHFMGKILKNLAKNGVLNSVKGPTGGFTTNSHSLDISLLEIMEITEGLLSFHNCALRLKECNTCNPCPFHTRFENVKNNLRSVLSETTITDLLKEGKVDFLESLSTRISVLD
jgi:Rrf2 family transcriptional regulator, iron-sulfur cluster assembly transcription factor